MFTVLICIVAFLYLSSLLKNYLRSPPGPYGLPIVGYYPFLGNDPNQTFYRLSKRHGSVMSINLLGETFWVLNSYEAVEEAFVTKGYVFSGKASNEYGLFNDLFKDTVGLDEGYEWKAKKKFILGHLVMLGMGKSEFEMNVHDILDDVMRYIDSNNGQPHNYSNILHNYTLNVISQMIFGLRFELSDPNYEKINNWFINIRSCFKYMNVYLSGNVFQLFVNYCTNYPKTLQSNIVEFEKFIAGLIEERLKTFDENNCRDFVDYWIKESRCSKDQYLKFRNLPKEIITMLYANQTAAAHLNLFLCTAALYPKIQRKVFKEIENAIGMESDFGYVDKDRMPYTQAVINENERFVAYANFSGVHVNRVPTRLMKYKVPKRQKVIANLYALSRDPKRFSNPYEYDPNNFLDEKGYFKPNMAYSAFGIGTRKCLGMKLGEMEIFLAFVRLIRKFEWTLPENDNSDSPAVTPGNVRFMQSYKLCAKRRH